MPAAVVVVDDDVVDVVGADVAFVVFVGNDDVVISVGVAAFVLLVVKFKTRTVRTVRIKLPQIPIIMLMI